MIINILKSIHKKIIYGYKSSSKSYLKYLTKKGVIIGNNVSFYEPMTNYIDTQKPFLIEIGNNVEITRGVTIITHDYSWSVIKQITGEIIGSREKVKIGNNVFIGLNTVILKGVSIGDNVIIGANSVISKDIPSNSVVCGNPAKIICSFQDFYKKRVKKYEEEAIKILNDYYKIYHEIPDKSIFDEFFWIFEERNLTNIKKEFDIKMKLTNNYEQTINKFINSKPKYNGYDDFVSKCLSKDNSF